MTLAQLSGKVKAKRTALIKRLIELALDEITATFEHDGM
jgi:hypothetical protein